MLYFTAVKGRNFREWNFRESGPFSPKFLPGKKSNQKFAKVVLF